MRRHFNGSERIDLYLAADGKCQGCGVELEPGWHADHREPYSRGGATDILNGQALCPTCNLSKGATMPEVLPWLSEYALRGWQTLAFRKYLQIERPDFMLVATPGAGKTTFALYVAHGALLEGKAVGRLVRVIGALDDEHSYFYIPKEPILVAYAETIRAERDHQLAEASEEKLQAEPEAETERQQDLSFHAMSAIGAPGPLIFQDEHFSQEELTRAATRGREAGVPDTIPPVYLAMYERLRRRQEGAPPPPSAPPYSPPPRPLEDRKKEQAKLIQRWAHKLSLATGTEHALIYGRMNQGQGVRSQGECTLDQLRERVADLRNWAKEEGISE